MDEVTVHFSIGCDGSPIPIHMTS